MKEFYKFKTDSPATSYIPLPRFLLTDETLKDLSNDAKVLYALLLDRASISKVNGYVEPDGTIRLYFTVESAAKKLHEASNAQQEPSRSWSPANSSSVKSKVWEDPHQSA